MRFWRQVDKDGPNGCWLWTGGKGRGGYGRFRNTTIESDPKVMAHRWAYEQEVGPIPLGMTIDHLCQTTACVNPSHMEVVSLSENVSRMRRARPLKTHCPQGHPYVGYNVMPQGDGSRKCRECDRIRHRRADSTPRAGLGQRAVRGG